MKALSCRQPWASLIVAGIKGEENRSRPTQYRGPVLIHAATRFDEKGATWVELTCPNLLTPLFLVWARSNFGAIIGQADLVDCVQNHTSPWPEPGKYHWVLANAKAFPQPVPYPGRLGLFDAPEPDSTGLFKAHDGRTRRVCVAEEPCDVMVTRPGFWGNPYRPHAVRDTASGKIASYWWVYANDFMEAATAPDKESATAAAVRLYEAYARRTHRIMKNLPMLKGKRLGCFCKPGEPCHGDVLVRLVGETG